MSKAFIEKDKNKLMKQIAKGEIYAKGIVKEQEAIMKKCESLIPDINRQLEKLKKELLPYIDGKETDKAFEEKKEKYEKLLTDKDNLEKALNLSTEVVAEYNLKYIGE